MATKKFKDIKKMNAGEREKKLKEFKMELVKSKASSAKSGSSKSKEIRKIIARMHTLNNAENKSGELSKK